MEEDKKEQNNKDSAKDDKKKEQVEKPIKQKQLKGRTSFVCAGIFICLI